MKIPKKMLFEMVMTGKLQKLDRSTDKWIEFDFEPGNEEHIHVKSMHYAQAEIDFVYETLELGIRIARTLN
jgi:hypothetical protein|tara:strand:- start:732 stop:944 length:213 start_codon:yes stop_codon:yes gene_type:complete